MLILANKVLCMVCHCAHVSLSLLWAQAAVEPIARRPPHNDVWDAVMGSAVTVTTMAVPCHYCA